VIFATGPVILKKFPAAGGTEILSALVPERELLFMEDRMPP